MVAQVPVSGERDRANMAFVGFDTVMDPHVYFEIAAFSEAFVANRAFEWLQSLMCSDVDLEAAGP